MKKLAKIFIIIFLFIICSFWVFAQTRQFWMTTVINNWTHSGSLWFFPPNSPNQNSQNQEPKMILTNSGLYLNGNFTLKNNSALAGKVLVSLDNNGNANWIDSLCPAGFALRWFDNNWQKECTELPFGIYRYPTFIRDQLVRESSVSVNFHSSHFFSPNIFSTNTADYREGTWRDLKKWIYTNRDDSNPDVDYCTVVGPAGIRQWQANPWADGVITSSLQWICRSEFADKWKTNFEEKWWIPSYSCDSSLCSNNKPGDNTNKRLRYRKTYYWCNVNTCRNILGQICDPNTSLVTTIDKCK